MGREGLPEIMENIPLEYFERAIEWLQKQPQVDPDKIIVMGASRNAELSLLLASTFANQIKGVIAYAPGSVVWSNTVMPYSSTSVKPSWTYKQQAIPFISMGKITVPDSSAIQTLAYWEKGLADTPQVATASIRVEQIQGPVLLLTGKDDKVWPSSLMSDMIENRLREHNFRFNFQNIQYPDAGHLISSDLDRASLTQKGQMVIDSKKYEYDNGGTAEGDSYAKTDARKKVLAFISKL
jgi:dienelactone hydrolase